MIPAADFTRPSPDERGTLQHIDWVDAEDPGVLWVDLDGEGYDTRHSRLAGYRVAAAGV